MPPKAENGREPTEDEVQQWTQTLKEAAEEGVRELLPHFFSVYLCIQIPIRVAHPFDAKGKVCATWGKVVAVVRDVALVAAAAVDAHHVVRSCFLGGYQRL